MCLVAREWRPVAFVTRVIVDQRTRRTSDGRVCFCQVFVQRDEMGSHKQFTTDRDCPFKNLTKSDLTLNFNTLTLSASFRNPVTPGSRYALLMTMKQQVSSISLSSSRQFRFSLRHCTLECSEQSCLCIVPFSDQSTSLVELKLERGDRPRNNVYAKSNL